MRTVTVEPKVGLLLFDEPSASLDPTAEHGAIFGQFLILHRLISSCRSF
jgi:ABC-type transporter Mla maintaining outer membrane lipid asymmetry ATPase subunit MlaF